MKAPAVSAQRTVSGAWYDHAPAAVPQLYRIKVRALWRFLRSQPASFWLVNFYMFVEYVRPQHIWPALNVAPWAQSAIVLALAALLFEGTRLRLPTLLSGLLVVFSAIVLLSSAVALNPSSSVARWEVFFSWVLVYVLISNTVTTEKRTFVFYLAFLLYSFKMSQHGFRTWMSNGFGFSSWGVTGAPGWFENSGEFGIQMCVFLPLSVEFIRALQRNWKWWLRGVFWSMPITAVAGMIASSSRGALIGGGAVALWWVMRSKHRFRALFLVVVLAIGTWELVPQEQKARFDTAGDDATSISRIDRWRTGVQLANQYPVLGIGYGNWLTEIGALSHNVFIEAWAELGYTGLIAFIALIVATFVVNARTRSLARRQPAKSDLLEHLAYGLDGALIGFLASGFFVTVLYYPYFWINLAMTTALHVTARNRYRIARLQLATATADSSSAGR